LPTLNIVKDLILKSKIHKKYKENLLKNVYKLGFTIEKKYCKKVVINEFVSYNVFLSEDESNLFPSYKSILYNKDFFGSQSINNLTNELEKYGNVNILNHGYAYLATEKEFEEIKKYLEKIGYSSPNLSKKFYLRSIEIYLQNSIFNENEILLDVFVSHDSLKDAHTEILEANAYISSLLSIKGEEISNGKLSIPYNKLKKFNKHIIGYDYWILNNYDVTKEEFQNRMEKYDKIVYCIEFAKSKYFKDFCISQEFVLGILKQNIILLGIPGEDSSSTRTCKYRIYDERWLDAVPLEKVVVVLYDKSNRKIIGTIKGLDERRMCVLEKENFGYIIHFPYLKGNIYSTKPFYFT
jgi:hypothetical protein